MVAGGGFYSYYNLQYIKLYKENNNSRKKKTVLCIQKTFHAVFKKWFQSRFGFNSTPTLYNNGQARVLLMIQKGIIRIIMFKNNGAYFLMITAFIIIKKY